MQQLVKKYCVKKCIDPCTFLQFYRIGSLSQLVSNTAITVSRLQPAQGQQKEPFPSSEFRTITINEGLKLNPNGGHCRTGSLPCSSPFLSFAVPTSNETTSITYNILHTFPPLIINVLSKSFSHTSLNFISINRFSIFSVRCLTTPA